MTVFNHGSRYRNSAEPKLKLQILFEVMGPSSERFVDLGIIDWALS